MTNEKRDVPGILSRVNIVDVVSQQVQLKPEGAEHLGLCPFHNDSKASLKVNPQKQIFKCFACGAGGDAVDFLTKGGMTFHEALDHLEGKTGSFNPSPVQIDRKPEKPKFEPIIPVPAVAPKPPTNLRRKYQGEWITLRFVKRWTYRDQSGALIGHVCRFHWPDGSKEVTPQMYGTDPKGKTRWKWAGFPKPRPIYGLDRLVKKPDATVMILEGEKAADHAAKLFPELACISWIGGTDGVAHIDWSPIAGRKIVIWPDNDEPGTKAAKWIGDTLTESGSIVRYITPPAGTPKGWDVADSDWTSDQALEYVKTKGVQVKTVPEPNYKPPDQPDQPEPEPEPPATQADQPQGIESEQFRFLGFEKTEVGQQFCFYVYRSKTIVRISASGMTKNNLLQLIPDPNWWELNFPAKTGFATDVAVSWLLSESYRVGIFDETLVRGRGAWEDAGRTVLHSGNYLVVDGHETSLGAFQTRYMYEQASNLEFHTDKPLTTKQASKLLEMLKLVNWERPVSAYLLAGWGIIAPICGALSWRPHIWITGGAGTGKSWVLEQVVRPLLGETGLAVQGETTEAGLRQTLKHDAMPIVFDEADTDGKNDNDRIQKVLAIMRSASTNDGGKIIKGSAGGRAQDFSIKSCFALGSIAVQAAKQADKTRISVLAIKRILDQKLRETRWKALQKMHAETITPEFCQRMQARTIKLIPTILKNARTFAAAAGAELGYQRTGDQVGTLLAGAYSLVSTKEVSYKQALEFVQAQNWDEERGLDEERDEIMLLNYILEQIISVEGRYQKFDRTIGELIQLAAAPPFVEGDIDRRDAQTRLSRCGIKVQTDTFAISNNSEYLKRILSRTPWGNGHHKILQRIEGSEQAGPIRYAAGMVSRAVSIPLRYVMDED